MNKFELDNGIKIRDTSGGYYSVLTPENVTLTNTTNLLLAFKAATSDSRYPIEFEIIKVGEYSILVKTGSGLWTNFFIL